MANAYPPDESSPMEVLTIAIAAVIFALVLAGLFYVTRQEGRMDAKRISTCIRENIVAGYTPEQVAEMCG